ncbi:MAG TPA: hypothetical protein VF498_01750 [Anaerolineales bacterium]
MYLEELVEVAIGLVLVFFIMSLACMQIQEILAGWLRWRSNHLEDALRDMLTDPVKRPKGLAGIRKFFGGGKNQEPRLLSFVDKFYEHPLIISLAQPGHKPSYIPTDKFALAVFDIVMTAGTPASKIQETLEELRNDPVMTISQAAAGILKDPDVRQALETDLLKLQQTCSDQSYHFEWGQKVNDLIFQHPELKPVLEARLYLERLVYEARCNSNSPVELNQLWKDIDNFNQLYPQIKLTLDAILQGKLPQQGQEVLDQIKNGAEVVMRDNPQLKRSLDSLIQQAEVQFNQTLDPRFRDQLKAGLAAIAKTKQHLENTIESAIDNTERQISAGDSTLAQARQNVEKWFNDTMDRSSGWYKRNQQFVSFLIGLTLAVGLNVDAITIANHLWLQPALRATLVSQAEKLTTSNASATSAAAGSQTSGQANDIGVAIKQVQDNLSVLKIPLGWNMIPGAYDGKTGLCTYNPNQQSNHPYGFTFANKCIVWADSPYGVWAWTSKIFGLVIIAGATTFGAPFWFDMLQKLVSIRNAGVKPEEKKAT